jgi:hypothetical protein
MAASRTSPFFGFTAWYALITPFIAAGLIGLGLHCGFARHGPRSHAEDYFEVAGVVLIWALLASITSVFGIVRGNSRIGLWKPVVGLVLSFLLFGLLFVIGYVMVISGQ